MRKILETFWNYPVINPFSQWWESYCYLDREVECQIGARPGRSSFKLSNFHKEPLGATEKDTLGCLSVAFISQVVCVAPLKAYASLFWRKNSAFFKKNLIVSDWYCLKLWASPSFFRVAQTHQSTTFKDRHTVPKLLQNWIVLKNRSALSSVDQCTSYQYPNCHCLLLFSIKATENSSRGSAFPVSSTRQPLPLIPWNIVAEGVIVAPLASLKTTVPTPRSHWFTPCTAGSIWPRRALTSELVRRLLDVLLQYNNWSVEQ